MSRPASIRQSRLRDLEAKLSEHLRACREERIGEQRLVLSVEEMEALLDQIDRADLWPDRRRAHD